jgi:hypothetical protein
LNLKKAFDLQVVSDEDPYGVKKRTNSDYCWINSKFSFFFFLLYLLNIEATGVDSLIDEEKEERGRKEINSTRSPSISM